MKIDILYQFNEKYAPYAGVSITSLLENNQHFEQIGIIILGENLSEISCRKLEQMVSGYGRKISFIDAEEQIDTMKKIGMPAYRGSYAANLRLFLPYLLEDSLEKILYLDADTVVTGNLEDLIADAGDDLPLYMVLDSLGMKHKEEIGLNENDYYFNSGVILFNLKKWKQMQLSDRIVSHVKKVRSNYPAPDQDLLNIVCKGQIGMLEPRYNFQPIHVAFSIRNYCNTYSNERYYSREELERAKGNPCIYHFFRFLGEFPWNKDNAHPDTELFDKYLRMSPWKDYEKKKAELGTVFRIEKLLYAVLPSALFLRIFKFAHRAFVKKSNKMSLENKVNPDM